MNAPFAIKRTETAPEWSHAPSKCDWQVMIFGGVDRNGFAHQPLEFQFYGPHYTRERVEQRVADLASWHKRTNWIVRAPAEARFIPDADGVRGVVGGMGA
jgi:hypothetical protein